MQQANALQEYDTDGLADDVDEQTSESSIDMRSSSLYQTITQHLHISKC